MTAKLTTAFAVCMALSLGFVRAEAKAEQADFVGSRRCYKCHADEFDSWKTTFHSKMVQKKDDGLLKAAAEKWESDGTNPGPKKGNVSASDFTLNDVELVVGSKWKQRYLVKNPATGGFQFLDKQFNRMSGKWEGYGNKNDWNTMCATCHTTGYRLTEYDPSNPAAQKSQWSEENVSCESCHGPGGKHIKSKSKADIWSFKGKSKEDQSRVCGYCHIRAENFRFKSAQGKPREDLPAPNLGETFTPGMDWTSWYPEQVVIPAVHPEDRADVEHEGDLKGMFLLDDISKANGVYEAAKHHQQYQEFVQSKHYTSGKVSCLDCHSMHAVEGQETIDPKTSCAKCHEEPMDVEQVMPGTAKTAANLFVRTHTFLKNQSRPSGPLASGEPEYLVSEPNSSLLDAFRFVNSTRVSKLF
ncbi:MAG: hypothetical protein NDJ89_02195 [Oligoflexia bacterium]|nr:hypothetical protein [Oligoflexia bacterium]